MAKQKNNLENGAKVSEELKDTMTSNPEITEVHFAANGHHYFNVHASADKKKYGRIIKIKKIVPNPKNPNEAKEVTEEYPDLATAIVETLSREQVLGSSDI